MNKKVKYIRVSTEEQNIDRQNLNRIEFSNIYIDKVSGSVRFQERREAKKLLKDLQSGQIDQIHVSSIDRLGRDILDILFVLDIFNKMLVSLYVENIGMYSLIDNKENPVFKMIVSVLGNVAEMERNHIRERQLQGIKIAKAKGIYKGRASGSCLSHDQILEKYKTVVKELTINKQSLRRAALLGECSLGTAQKVKRILVKRGII